MPRMAPKDADRLAGNRAVDDRPGARASASSRPRSTPSASPTSGSARRSCTPSTAQALLDVVELGQGELVHSTIIGPEWATYDDLNPYPYDPERAKSLLAEAGWDTSQTVELTWSKGFQAIELAAPVFQQQLAEVGVNVELAPLETAAYLKKVVEEPDFDLAWFGGGSYRLDPDVSSAYYLCANWTPDGANTTHYCNEDLDALFIEGRATPDTARVPRSTTRRARS